MGSLSKISYSLLAIGYRLFVISYSLLGYKDDYYLK